MEKEFIIKAWGLIKDAMNGNNRTLVIFATDDLFHRIEYDNMNTLKDYIEFKNEWYPQLKNK
jgi:hypothetical protein